MASVRERIFALVSLVVILIGVVALSAAVVVQQIIADRTQSQTPPALTCTDSNAEQTFPAPEKYVPPQPVTALDKTDITAGSGQEAKSGDCLVVKYYGTLASDGTKFDENYTQPTAFAFTLGSGGVIPGWDQGLVGMKVGGERRLTIPAELAYGNAGRGSIPANAALVFYVRLLRIQK